eukprot:gene54582-53069_t
MRHGDVGQPHTPQTPNATYRYDPYADPSDAGDNSYVRVVECGDGHRDGSPQSAQQQWRELSPADGALMPQCTLNDRSLNAAGSEQAEGCQGQTDSTVAGSGAITPSP